MFYSIWNYLHVSNDFSHYFQKRVVIVGVFLVFKVSGTVVSKNNKDIQ